MPGATEKTKYPYSKSRVYLSMAIALMALFLAGALFQSDPTLGLTYLLYSLLATLVVIGATFLLKMRLYPLIAEPSEATDNLHEQTKRSGLTSKGLLLVFLMLIAPILVPLLLSGVLGGLAWLVMMTSYILGVSVSEILIYLYAR